MEIIKASELPKQIGEHLSEPQTKGLAFSKGKFKLISDARIQTFQVGSSTKGTITSGGGGASIGSWAVFGALSGVNEQTINKFKTDIQFRLEDPGSSEKLFIQNSVPFEITLSIDSGDMLTVYYAKGGLPGKLINGDFRLDEWTPFMAQNDHTSQIIPLGSLPTLRKKPNLDIFIGVPIACAFLVGFSMGGGQTANSTWLFLSLGIIAALAFKRNKQWEEKIVQSKKLALNP